jgi:hypothetical protein
MLALIGACIITVDVMFETYVRMYGVACVLLLLSSICMFFFLQFETVLVTTVTILAYYIGAGLVANVSGGSFFRAGRRCMLST